MLRPGGSLLLSTPNLAAWYNRGLLAFGVQPIFSEVSLRGVYGRPGSVVAGHLRLFTRRALTEFLAGSGFRCVTVTGARYHGVPRPLGPLDRAFCRWPSAASILLVHARKALVRDGPGVPNQNSGQARGPAPSVGPLAAGPLAVAPRDRGRRPGHRARRWVVHLAWPADLVASSPPAGRSDHDPSDAGGARLDPGHARCGVGRLLGPLRLRRLGRRRRGLCHPAELLPARLVLLRYLSRPGRADHGLLAHQRLRQQLGGRT